MNEKKALQEQTFHRCCVAEGQDDEIRAQLQNEERRKLCMRKLHQEASESRLQALVDSQHKVASLQRELSTVTISELYRRQEAQRIKRELAQVETRALCQRLDRSTKKLGGLVVIFTAK